MFVTIFALFTFIILYAKWTEPCLEQFEDREPSGIDEDSVTVEEASPSVTDASSNVMALDAQSYIVAFMQQELKNIGLRGNVVTVQNVEQKATVNNNNMYKIRCIYKTQRGILSSITVWIEESVAEKKLRIHDIVNETEELSLFHTKQDLVESARPYQHNSTPFQMYPRQLRL